MKHHILFTVFTLFFNASLFAQSPIERELAQAKEQRDKALTTAAEPIQRKYQATLEQLLRRAMQANDLEAAIKIKGEIKKLPRTNAEERNDLANALRGSKWTWEPPNGTVAFDNAGKMTASAGWSCSWEVTAPRTVTLRSPESGTATLQFDEEFTKFSGHDFSGTIPVKGARLLKP